MVIRWRVLVAAWLLAGFGLAVGAYRANMARTDFPIVFAIQGIEFGLAAGALCALALFILRPPPLPAPVIGALCGLAAAVVFIVGYNLWLTSAVTGLRLQTGFDIAAVALGAVAGAVSVGRSEGRAAA